MVVPSGSSSHYFDSEPSAASDTRTVELVLPDVSFRLTTDRGVFGRDRVDPGTKLLLLDGPHHPPTGPQTSEPPVLVDLGAGYGPIACALAARNPDASVLAVEVNARARELCVENAKRARLTNVSVVAPDEVPGDLAVDAVWSNPPIRVGKTVLHDLLTTWLDRLATHGAAHLVVQRHLGADSLAKWLEREGHAVSRRASKKAYRLLDVYPRADGDEHR